MTNHTTNPPTPEGYKRCSRGENCIHPDGPILPATPEYFHRNRRNKDGFNGYCKQCWLDIERSRYHDDIEKSRKEGREYRRAYVAQNKDKVDDYRRNYIENNREKTREKDRRHYYKHAETKRAKHREWTKNNPDKVRIHKQNRKARKLNLPQTFTLQDWERAIEYFHGCCSVCGHPLNDLFRTHTGAADHWIPLASPDCPGTIATNIVPLCQGLDGCNNSKHDDMPEEWLNRKYGKRKGKEILERIQQYFDWVKKQNEGS